MNEQIFINNSLFDGVNEFMENGYLEHKDLFVSLSSMQTPHTLFIGCSDSRVVPSLITSSKPGELFVVRNIANIVPPYRLSDEFLATTSAIEYAINVFDLKDIVICGHSNCGGCEALYYDKSKLEKIPNVRKWLEILSPIKHAVLEVYGNNASKRSWVTERLNIINSIDNILTFPTLKEKFESGKINIHGWHYIIETGEIFEYDFNSKQFKFIGENDKSNDK
ncbi:carbonic anhydrase [Campylobacter sputorum]|uniref:carbonic anhydrase n=1 Tax=Campylobacter sputorum TaxID=206 RepID=UPI00053BFDDD|nr:carbonic anhydrase [Campylobacter sputorum]